MNREAILGIILMVVLLVMFGPKFLGSDENSSQSGAQSVQFEDQNNQINSIKAQYSTAILSEIRYRTAMEEKNSWNYGAAEEFVAETTTEAVITVQAILGDELEAFALINDNICSIGDKVLNYLITAIDPVNQTVTLQGPDSERVLTVSE